MKKFNMKAIVLATAVALGGLSLGGAAMAQGKFGGERFEQMKTELNLTDAQEKALKASFEKRRASFKALKQDESLSKEDRRAKKMEMKAAMRADLQATLTPEQFAKVEAKMAERGKKGPKGQRGQRGERLERLATELNLDDAQKAKVKGIIENSKLERQTIIEANAGDRKAAKPELKAHRQKTAEQIRTVLTPAQAKQFDELKERRMKRGKGERGPKNRG